MTTSTGDAPTEHRSDATEGDGYRGDIQAMRGLAVLVVVIFHAGFGLPGGFVGVDVFFVISGFVITGVIQRQLEVTGSLRFADFYARRARRILPALALMTIVVLVVSIFVLSPTGAQQNAAKTGAAASVFSGNIYLYRYGVDYFNPGDVNPFLHTWSLGVEEQTYLILPITLVALWAIGRRFGRSRSVAVAGVVAMGFVSFVLSAALSAGSTRLPLSSPEKFAFFSPFTRLWEFAFGVVLALVVHRLPRRSVLGAVLGMAGLALVMVACVVFDEATRFPGTAALLPVVGAALMIVAGSVSLGWRRATAGIGPMVWLGGLSYAWYLWHWPLIVFADVLWPGSTAAIWAAVGLSLAASVGGRRLVETRFRYDKRIVGRRALALTAVCIAVPVLGATVVLAGGDHSWGNDELAQRVAESKLSRTENDGCDSITRTSPCVYRGGGNATVALVGDSHAGAISDVVMASTLAHAADFEVWTRAGCRLVPTSLRGGRQQPQCQDWSNEVLAWLREHPPDVLVVHEAANADAGTGPLQNGAVAAEAAHEEAVAFFVDGLVRVQRELAPLGTRMIVVSDVPTFGESKVQLASLLHPDPTPSWRDRRDVEQQLAALERALADLGTSTGTIVIDPKQALCGPKRCSQYRDGWLYRDSNHLTPRGAGRLRGMLDEAIAGATSGATSGGTAAGTTGR